MPKPTFRSNDLIKIIEENIKLLNQLDTSLKINFSSKSNFINFECDKEQLSRVFLNLIKNSIESVQQKYEKNPNFNKKIDIEINENDLHITFIIIDNGVGFKNISTNIKDILNPYFTTKKNGTGLGLSIVNKIVNDHNGKINFIPIEDGAKILIEFVK